MLIEETNNTILTAEEAVENEKTFQKLLDAFSSDDMVLFIGSGPSIDAGYLNWDGLLAKLESKLSPPNIPSPNIKGDPLKYAFHLKQGYINEYGNLNKFHSELTSCFNGKAPTELHRLIVDLPCQIITTNYDLLLSDALSTISSGYSQLHFEVNQHKVPLISQFLMSFNKSLNIQKMVAHLHGSVSDIENIILCAKDYKLAYDEVPANPRKDNTAHETFSFIEKIKNIFSLNGDKQNPGDEFEYDQKNDWPLHRKILWSLLATRRIVFVGFGMRDPYLINLLKNANADLWRWGKNTHYNIVSISKSTKQEVMDKAKQIKEDYGVETIFYECINHDHTLLTKMFSTIHELYGEKNGTLFSEELNIQDESKSSEISDVVSEAAGTAVPSNWLNQSNKKMKLDKQNEN